MGEDKKSVVTGVEMFRKLLDQGEAGDNVGLLLRGIDKNEIKRGMVICHPGQVKPHDEFKAQVYILRKRKVDVTLHSTTTIAHNSTSVRST